MNFMSGRPGFYEDVTANASPSRRALPPNYAYTAATPSSNTAPADDRLPMLYSAGSVALIEREHMFDKVVTPSDVGKLNRLVIPKQYAEKYFPMDSSANEKGLLLNFEDRNGKPWRFRYSYWNSSQSYVMTKGWSRFVKEKKLDAGDVVSFYRGVGESGKDRLFIDWRRRLDVPQLPPPIPVLSSIPNQFSLHHPYWHPLFLSHHRRHTPTVGYSPYYEKERGIKEMVYSSVPVVQGMAIATAKRLRLFGVNMDCPITVSDKCDRLQSSSTTTLPSPPLSLSSSTTHTPNYNHKGKAASISLDLDISLL